MDQPRVQSEILRPSDPVPGATRCTAFDRILGFSRPSLTFCYEERLDVERLRASLSKILREFGAYSGTFEKRNGELWIAHGTGGALFEVAHRADSSRALGAIASTNRGAAKQICPSLGQWWRSDMRVLFAVRVTQTVDGTVLAVTWSHATGDLTSTMLLMRAWTRAYQDQPYEVPCPVNDRMAYLDERMPATSGATSMHVASWTEWLRHLPRYLPRGARPLTLEFSTDELSAIQAKASRERSVTVHDALCAHVFAMIHRLHDPDSNALLMLSIDYRKRIGLPANLVGNFFDGLKTAVKPGDDTASIAAHLRNGVESFPQRPTFAQELARLHERHPETSRRIRCVDGDMDPRTVGMVLTMTTHLGAGIYQLAFEKTTPIYYWCRPADSISWLSLVMETPDRSGLRLCAYLPSDLSKRLEHEHARSHNA